MAPVSAAVGSTTVVTMVAAAAAAAAVRTTTTTITKKNSINISRQQSSREIASLPTLRHTTALKNTFPAPFSQISTKKPRRMTYKRQFPLMYLWASTIIMMVFVTVRCSVGDDGAAGCPARCSCTTVDGFVNGREVKCSYIGLSYIPAMWNSSTIHTLDLSNNEISILINASFSSYLILSALILSYSKVEEIEINAFVGLQMLRDIDLSYNKLQSFSPKIFSSNPVLENVSLRGNGLVYLSSDLPILISNSISSLDLSFCSLTKIHSVTFSSLPSLYDLDLSSNNLQTISLHTLEKLPDLRLLELNNNRWKCNCDIVEVMQWADLRRGQQSAHKPVKCLEGQQYRILWTMAGGNRSCSESKTTEPVVASNREFTTDMTVELLIISESSLLPLKSSPDAIPTIMQRDRGNEVKNYGDFVASRESETGGLPNLLPLNLDTLMVFVILPITLGVAVFVALIAVNYVVKRGKDHPAR